MNNENSNYEDILKDIFLWIGIGLALLSIYFSWDGLYKSVPPEKAASTAAKWIGLLLAIGFTALQFIFNSDFKRLNPTLFLLGLISYVYSILTNKWGIADIFGFPDAISWVIAFGMDVAPEAMIAWSLEDITKGDMIGNIMGKLGSLRRVGSGRRNQNQSQKPKHQYSVSLEHDTQPRMKPAQQQPKKGQGRHYWEGQKLSEREHQQGKSNGNEKKDVNRFSIFED